MLICVDVDRLIQDSKFLSSARDAIIVGWAKILKYSLAS